MDTETCKQQQKADILGEMTNSRARAMKLQDESLEHYVLPGNKETLKNKRRESRSKEHKNSTEAALDSLS